MSVWGNIFHKKEATGDDVFSILKKIPIFSGLKDREIKEVEHIVHHRSYKADEVIFHEGEPGLGMYIIQHGEVGIVQGGKELVRLTKGDFFGEIALLTEEPRSATAMSFTDSEVMGFFRPDLLDLLESHHRIGVNVLMKVAEVIAARLRKTTEELQSLKIQLQQAKSGQ